MLATSIAVGLRVWANVSEVEKESSPAPNAGGHRPRRKGPVAPIAGRASAALQKRKQPQSVVFKPMEWHDAEGNLQQDTRNLEYVIDTRTLGPQALYWAAAWCEGYFSLTDIIGYTPVLASLSALSCTGAGAGMVYEVPFAMDFVPFCTAVWEFLREQSVPVSPTVGDVLFSRILLSTLLPEGWVGAVLNTVDSAEFKRWRERRNQLPFLRKQQLLLPA